MGIIDPEEADENGVVDDDGSASDTEYMYGSGSLGASTDVDVAKIKEVEEVQRSVKATTRLKIIRRHRIIPSIICPTLGHGTSG